MKRGWEQKSEKDVPPEGLEPPIKSFPVKNL